MDKIDRTIEVPIGPTKALQTLLTSANKAPMPAAKHEECKKAVQSLQQLITRMDQIISDYEAQADALSADDTPEDTDE